MADYNLRVFDSVLDMLSNEDNPTPLVRIQRVSPFKYTKVYAKLEWYNPFGAVKDRVAANLVRDAEERGVKLQHLVEPTSGNTGMGLAMIANAKGYSFTASLSVAVPAEKRATLRAFGAQLLEVHDDLCPMPGAPEGAMQRAEDLAKQPGYTQLNQYKNPANPDAHFRTTGPEVWKQTQGTVTHFVASLGTCGTITGTGRFLKSKKKDVKVIGAHPTEGHDIPGVRSIRALKLTDFFLPQEYDGLEKITDAEAYQLCKRLNQEESIVAGPSSGLALAAAFKAVPDEPGNVVVVIFPDNVFKYTSSLKKHLPELFPQEAAPSATTATSSESLEIDHDQAVELLKRGAVLLDVRTAQEFDAGHIVEATNISLQTFQAGNFAGLPEDKNTQIVTICAAGRRSMAALELIKAQGHQKVLSIAGGMNAWTSNGHSLKIL